MKKHLLSATGLGLGLTVILLSLLAHAPTIARADPGVYYVRAGATGDCLSSATPCGSVQSAIDLALVPGDEVWVAGGVFTENVVITYSLDLRGGWNISFTVQNPAATPTILDGDGGHVISALDGSGPGLIEGFTVRNGRDGIHVYSGVYTLSHNVVYSTARQGIEVTTGEVWIESNVISETAEEGISVNGGTAVISANLVFDTGLDGIHTDDASVDVTIHGNTVYSTASDGIDSRAQMAVVVSNTIYDVGKDGVHLEDVGNGQVVSNTVYDTAAYGIYARDAASGVSIRGNTVYSIGVGGDGIYGRSSDFFISANTVHHTVGDGIRTHDSSGDVKIRANTIRDTGDDGIDARGDTVWVFGNLLDDCTDNGIKSETSGSTTVATNQVYGAGDAGIDLDDAGAFSVVNNVVVGSSAASVLVQTAAGADSLIGHNTLVGGGGGDGISVTVASVPILLVNNVIVSHEVGIDAVPGAELTVENTLRWANGDDPGSAVATIVAPPRFVDPAQRDYHLLPGSPAIDAGSAGIGVDEDMDGDPRPIGPLPDVGADEFPAALSATKWADVVLVQPGASLTYTLRVTNTGIVALSTIISDVLPERVSPTGTLTWSVALAPGGIWMKTVVVTVEAGLVGPLVNVIRATSDEGAASVYTHTLAPALELYKRADPDPVRAGERLTYTIYATNTGYFALNAVVTDTLPVSITSAQVPGGTTLLPGQQVAWAASLPTPGDVWMATVVVTTRVDYHGPLTNVVQATTVEGAADNYTAVSTVVRPLIYLPLVVRNYQPDPPPNLVQNPGFEGLDCHPSSPPGWCYENWTYETHNGEYHDNIMTPQGWVTWWDEDNDYGQPEGKPIPNQPPYDGDPPRIHSGNYASQLFTFFRAHDAGLYQVVTGLSPGETVQFSAYAHGWSCDSDYPAGFSCGDPWGLVFQVGIEPDGVADPFSSSVVWSAQRPSPDYYSLIGPVSAQVGASGSVCVYVRSWAKWGVRHNDAYWDDAELIVQYRRSDSKFDQAVVSKTALPGR
jgi:uncharacterized repeat protein (TIGR01451 family)